MAIKKKSRKSAKSKLNRRKSQPKSSMPRKKRSPKASPKKKAVRRKAVAKKASKKATKRKPSLGRGQSTFRAHQPAARSAEQSGDLQGLSHSEGVDSESVGELLEEGNAFEAGVLTGVEDAGRQATREVRTHQVPEDDVPAEYLDEE
jgi:hypothetical protein